MEPHGSPVSVIRERLADVDLSGVWLAIRWLADWFGQLLG
jgi:hypothetical protein